MAGSIEKRGKNSYRLTVSEGFDLNGKPMIHRKTVHGNKKDAEVELAKFVTEVQNGLIIDGKSLKFSEFTEIWKRDYGSKELAPSTYKRYCRMLETRLLPYFGHFYINKIKPTDIMKFYDLLEKDTQLVQFEFMNIGTLHADHDTPDVILLTQLRERIRFIRTKPTENMSLAQQEWMRQVSYRYATPGNLYRYAQALALNNQSRLAKKHLLILEKLYGKKYSFESLFQVNKSLVFEWQNKSISKP